MRATLLLALIVGVAPGQASAGFTPQPWPAAGAMTVEAFVPEDDGTGWALRSNGALLYWAGGAFHAVPGDYSVVASSYRRFYGDALRGYSIQCLDSYRNLKYVCRLADGRVWRHTKPLTVKREQVEESLDNTYVAQDGRVVSWNTERVALWQNDDWSFLPAPVASDEGLPVLLEHDGHIILVCGLIVHVIAPDGKLTTRRPGWKDPTFSCVQWKGATAIRTVRGLTGPQAFDLLSGQPLPLPASFAEVREPVTTLVRSTGGSVWTKTGRALYRLGPGGKVLRLELPTVDSMELVMIADRADTGAASETEPGWDVVFTDRQPGLVRWNASGVERWDPRKFGLPNSIRDCVCTADRCFWFVAGGIEARVFRLPLDDAPQETLEEQPGRWQTFKIFPGSRPMEMDGAIAFLSESGRVLKRWDGNAFTEQALPPSLTNGVLTGVASDNQGHVYLRHAFRTAPFESLTDMSPAAVKVVSDGFTHDPQGKFETALVQAVNRGAAAFNFPGWDVTVTPEKKIWLLDRNEEAVRHYDGIAWRRISIDGSVRALTWSRRDGVVLRMRDNRTLVYDAGLFVEKPGVAAEAPLSAQAEPAVETEGTPLSGRAVSARFADRQGNLWFWLGQESAVAHCRVADLRVTACGVAPPLQPDRLTLRASVSPPLKGVRFAARLNGAGAWQPLQTPLGAPARLRFPCSGTYTCEVAAVFLGVRLPQTARLTHEARVALPDTRLDLPAGSGAPWVVSRYVWHPPVAAVPSSFARGESCVLTWRPADSSEPWQPLDAGGRFPLRRLGTNGVYRLEFAAQEEGFWCDATPVRLAVRLALDEEGQLLLTLDNLAASEPALRAAAQLRLEANRERWLPLLERLRQQTSGAQSRLAALRSVQEALRQTEKYGNIKDR